MSVFSELPKHLVRYRPAGSAHLDDELKNLAEGKVFLQKLSLQNDQTEGRPQRLKCSTAELIDLSRRLIQGSGNTLGHSHELRQAGKNRESTRTYLAKRRKWQKKFISIAPKHIRIACFSIETKDNEGYMWREYGSNGCGFRLHFSFNQDVKPNRKSFWIRAHYSHPRERRKISEAELLAAEFHINGANVFANKPSQWIGILQAFAACKPSKWAVEEELRLTKFSLSPSTKPKDSYIAVPSYSLSGATFGWNADQDLINKVKQNLGDDLDYFFQQEP